jgi:2-oxoglutarate ferredoxin oxidoreductase subunit gamma
MRKMTRTDIKLVGFGGQGIILSGIILGRAASLYDKKNAVQTQSYGAEARGGFCSSTITISTEEIICLIIEKPDVLVALNQKGFDENIKNVKKTSLVLVDSSIVKNAFEVRDGFTIGIPFTRIAEKDFSRICANMIMLGALVRFTKVVTINAVLEAVRDSAPKESQQLNSDAIMRGYRIKTIPYLNMRASANEAHAYVKNGTDETQ